MASSLNPFYIPYGPPVSRSVDRLVPDGQSDLVVCPHFTFNNRWESTNDLVDYAVVERPSTARLECKNWNIKRLKIVNVSRLDKQYLLLNLENSNLAHLEIDKLEVVQRRNVNDVLTFNFDNLEVLSISSIVTVDDHEKELPNVRSTVKINAILLKDVHLGKQSLCSASNH